MGKTKRKSRSDGPHTAKKRRTKKIKIGKGGKVEARLTSKPEKQTSEEFRAEMERLKKLRKEETNAEKRKAMAARHAQIKREFLKWQDDLCWLIRNQSRVEVQPDGTARYILPKELVRLVWMTTIKQRVAAERAKGIGPAEALAKAMEGLSSEVGSLATKVREETSSEGKHGRPPSADGASADEPRDERQDLPAS